MPSYDVIGSIAILKFRDEKLAEKKKQAEKILEEHKNIKTILEKTDKVKGRLRTIKTRFLAGINTKETIHKESGCLFKLNVEKCYFSPRLAGERLEIAEKIKQGRVLVMFAGILPFSIVIAKKSNAEKIVSVELGRECCKYAKENLKLNHVENKIKIIQGDVKKIKQGEKFDYIVMPRPQLKETFLKSAFDVSKKNTIIFYYDFSDNAEKILEKIKNQAKLFRKKIQILEIKKAGDIAPYKFRFRVEIKVC